MPTIGPPDLNCVQTTCLASRSTWSFWDLPNAFGRRSALGGVHKIMEWSIMRKMGLTAGGERASVAARGVHTTGRSATSVRTMALEHNPEVLVRGLAGAWGCMGLGQ